MSGFDPSSGIDELILPVVQILNDQGFKTFDSCQGGEGHPFQDGYIRFTGSEYDLMRAYEICSLYGILPLEAHRIYPRQRVFVNDNTPQVAKIGETWGNPYNELLFLTSVLSQVKHQLDGAITHAEITRS